jgi:hypothetical protein
VPSSLVSDSPPPPVALALADRRPGASRASRGRAPGPTRAPALYVHAWDSPDLPAPVAFRLPCPPTLSQSLGVPAAERRVRKAYFATLDALRTGRVDPEAEARLARLTRDVRPLDARRELQQLQRVRQFVRTSAAGWPVIPAPRAPLVRLTLTVPPDDAAAWSEPVLTDRYAWALAWMRMHRWVAGRGLVLEWRRPGPVAERDRRRAA